MSGKTIKPIRAPSDDVVYAASAMLRKMPEWRQVLKPMLDAAARDLGAQSNIAHDVPKALDEFGQYCRLLGKEIKRAQSVRVQQAIAPAPVAVDHSTPGPTRQIGRRREGLVPSSSASPAGAPRKPARRD